MRVIFLIARIGYYRYYVPLIREALQRGYAVECWHEYNITKKGAKGFSFPYVKDAPDITVKNKKPEIVSFYGMKELEEKLLKKKDIDIVVSIQLPGCYSGYRIMNKIVERRKFKWITLMSSAPDSFIGLVKLLKQRPDYRFDEPFFIHGRELLKMACNYFKKYYPEYLYIFNKKYINFKVIGTPEFDTFKGINKDEVRKKYKIPQGKSILLYLPFPYTLRNRYSAWDRAFAGFFLNTLMSKDGSYIHNKKNGLFKFILFKTYCLLKIILDKFALKYLILGWTEKSVFKAVRRFADKNNQFMVVKPRMKFPLIEIIKKKADLIIWDTEKQQDPAIMKELLSLAKLTISFSSYSVLTSIFADVYHLNIELPFEFFIDKAHKFWFPYTRPSIFNFSGVCDSWSIKKVINRLYTTPIKNFSVKSAERKKYIKLFNEYDDYNTSGRFFNYIESYLKKSGIKK